jgi:hypothetical protein
MNYNLYCDESCHLENDGINQMFLSCISCPTDKVAIINNEIRAIKEKHGISTEMKWVKVSQNKEQAYIDLVNYFFDKKELRFRILIVDNKQDINHDAYLQDHNIWYYKMYYHMLNPIISLSNSYCIYLDKKDTRTKTRVHELWDVLSNKKHDYTHTNIPRIQVIQSHEVEIMQLVDIIMGAVAYEIRGLNSMQAKLDLASLIKLRTGRINFKYNSSLSVEKFNLFHLQLEKTDER